MNRDPFGGKSASFDDPLAMLSACHERIRRQLDTLSRLERHLPEHGCDTDARVAARAILRYFDAAAPHHHEDEEVDVFPRVVARAPECAALVARLEEEHAALAANWLPPDPGRPGNGWFVLSRRCCGEERQRPGLRLAMMMRG